MRRLRVLGHLGRGSAQVKDAQLAVTAVLALTRVRQSDYQTEDEAGTAAFREHPFGVHAMMNPLLWLILTLIRIYIYILIAAAVLSWLIAFNVVNSHNPTVRMIWDLFYRLTEPALRPIRTVLPNLGGIDISPVILIIGLMFLEYVVLWLFG
jgi:YggT family protein